jgi:hypothetical protein
MNVQHQQTDEVRFLRSGEVASASGVNPQTLRYYERRGLLAPRTATARDTACTRRTPSRCCE